MQLSPSTISTLIAVLSAQGISTSGSELSALLAPLTGVNPGIGPNTLQPGETVNVMNHNTGEFVNYDTLEVAQEEITSFLSEKSFPDDYLDDIEVSIVRKRLEVIRNTSVSFK